MQNFLHPPLQLLPCHNGNLHLHCDGFHITCVSDGCKQTYTNFRRFKEHLRKVHSHPFLKVRTDMTVIECFSHYQITKLYEERGIMLCHLYILEPGTPSPGGTSACDGGEEELIEHSQQEDVCSSSPESDMLE